MLLTPSLLRMSGMVCRQGFGRSRSYDPGVGLKKIKKASSSITESRVKIEMPHKYVSEF
jgi:hypothetical protein